MNNSSCVIACITQVQSTTMKGLLFHMIVISHAALSFDAHGADKRRAIRLIALAGWSNDKEMS